MISMDQQIRTRLHKDTCQDGSSKVVGLHRQRGDGQKLANRKEALRPVCFRNDVGFEVGPRIVGVLQGVSIWPGQEPRVPVMEPSRVCLAGEVEADRQSETSLVLGIVRVAAEDDAVRQLGRGCCEGITECRPKTVADVDDLVWAWNSAMQLSAS